MVKHNLTLKQLSFCEEYVIDLNGSAAAIRAGYSAKCADSRSSKLLSNITVRDYIAALRAEKAERNELTADMVLQELQELAFYNIQDFINDTNGIEGLKSLKRRIAKPVVGIKVVERFTESGDRIVTTELKLADKRAALEQLGKHLGIYEKDNNQKSIKIKVTRK